MNATGPMPPAKRGKAASGQIWGSWSDAGAARERLKEDRRHQRVSQQGARRRPPQRAVVVLPRVATCDRAAPTLGAMQLWNGNLRPETLGAPRRERSPEPAKPTAETGSPRTAYGNVGLFLTLGSHVGLCGTSDLRSARTRAR